MSPERWRQIKQMFHAALAREAPTRPAFLEQACGSDPALRVEVESLLAAHDTEPDFIERPALTCLADADELGAGEMAGRTIGPYRLERPIGYGGMGAVYLAGRADHVYRKKVAVKLIRADRLSYPPRQHAQMQRRFLAERQALADLDHPSIARLLDGGADADGAPYLVMEYVDGVPIDEHCDAGRLTTRQRLELFQVVCVAVQHAHQRLIVHRDLKPGNILVTANGTPKLLDFGIAKLLEPDSARGQNPTLTTWPWMTPEYASPEQIQGRAVTTAADVYSLGVVLYELLTGHRPYRLGEVPRHEVPRVICEHEPDKPSTAVMRVEERPARNDSDWIALTPQSVSLTRETSPERLRRRLTGDLDTIVLKALRKEPQRRYASVEQFAEDIRRHLVGLPVTARPDTLVYRSGKFVRRHRIGVAVSAVTAALLAAATATTAWSAREATTQRDAALVQKQTAERNLARAVDAERLASLEADNAEAVTRFLVDLFEVSDPFTDATGDEHGKAVTAEEALDRGAARIGAEWEGQPEIQAALMCAIGTVYERLARYDKAEPLLIEALRLRREQFDRPHVDISESLQSLAWLRHHQGQPAEAQALFTEALQMREQLLGDDHPRVAESLTGLAVALRDLGEMDEAERHLRRALDIYRRHRGPRHRSVAATLANLARLLISRGHYAQAESLLRESLDIYDDRSAGIPGHRRGHPSSPGLPGDRGALPEGDVLDGRHPYVATAMSLLAEALRGKGAPAAAEPYCRKAVDLKPELLGDGHPEVASALAFQGMVLIDTGDYAAAESVYREALDIYERTVSERHPDRIKATDSLAHVLKKLGRYPEAEALYRQALALHRSVHGDWHPETARCLNNLASLLHATGQYPEAEELYHESLAVNRRAFGETHEYVAGTLANLAALSHVQGKYAEAASAQREALALQREIRGPRHPVVATSLHNLGLMLRNLDELGEAEQNLREALSIRRESLGDGHPLQGKTLCALASVHSRQQRYDEAAALLEEALTINREALPPGHPDLSEPLAALGICLLKQQSPLEAEPLLREAFDIRQTSLPAGHWLTATTACSLGDCLIALERFDEADALLTQSFDSLRTARGIEDRLTQRVLHRLIALYEAWDRAEQAAQLRPFLNDPPAAAKTSATVPEVQSD
ncbi:MAG: serine/threonine protein kinase [bacterium]|nr:serine/threonine protein kinase [bacterium]